MQEKRIQTFFRGDIALEGARTLLAGRGLFLRRYIRYLRLQTHKNVFPGHGSLLDVPDHATVLSHWYSLHYRQCQPLLADHLHLGTVSLSGWVRF